MSESNCWGVKCGERYCRWRGSRVIAGELSSPFFPVTKPCPRCGGDVELTEPSIYRAINVPRDQARTSRSDHDPKETA